MPEKVYGHTGRPRTELTDDDWEDVEKLCKMHATKAEIAAWLNISEDTIEKRIKERFDMTFTVFLKQKSQGGKASLRRTMFQNAIEHNNTTMQIWLSKQHLDMKDQPLPPAGEDEPYSEPDK